MPHSEYLFSDEYETADTELHAQDGNWVLHVHCKTDVESNTPEQATTENGTVLGSDLGVNNLAVTSTGAFWTDEEFECINCEYENHTDYNTTKNIGLRDFRRTKQEVTKTHP